MELNLGGYVTREAFNGMLVEGLMTEAQRCANPECRSMLRALALALSIQTKAKNGLGANGGGDRS
ncbi:hypothetical protein A9R05_21275 [Burkholderia sp. KK1]|nr:hypothetical protein A9R05_21275 [Burkholderia sp. KK1]